MDQEIKKAKNLIKKAEKILIIPHARMDGDAFSSTAALFIIFKNLNKKPTAICSDPVPEIFKFLPGSDVFKNHFLEDENFVIKIDCSKTHPKKLKWKIEDEKLNIFLSAENGKFLPEDVSFGSKRSFDLVVCPDVASLEQLGDIFEKNPEIFQKTPIIVFDHHASNTGFGTANIIDPKAASTTEIIFESLPEILGENWEEKISPDVATLLLTGIITDTGSFQNPNTTPRSFEVAADLIDFGARQQEIIRHIFKTKSLETLKLWGRVLSKIQTDPISRLVWSTVSKEDLEETNSESSDTEGIIDELLSTAPGAEIVILIKQREDGIVSGSIRTSSPTISAARFAAEFGGGGHNQAAGFKIRSKKKFDILIGEIITAAQNFQKKRLGIEEEEEGIVSFDNFQKKSTKTDSNLKNILNNQKEAKNEIDILEKISENKNLLGLQNNNNTKSEFNQKKIDNFQESQEEENLIKLNKNLDNEFIKNQTIEIENSINNSKKENKTKISPDDFSTEEIENILEKAKNPVDEFLPKSKEEK